MVRLVELIPRPLHKFKLNGEQHSSWVRSIVWALRFGSLKVNRQRGTEIGREGERKTARETDGGKKKEPEKKSEEAKKASQREKNRNRETKANRMREKIERANNIEHDSV